MVASGQGKPTRIFLTGRPGVGKTTVVLRTVEALRPMALVGFYTRERRRGGERVGFEAIGLRSGLCRPLAEAKPGAGPRVGRYLVCTDAFSELLAAEFAAEWRVAELIVLDEVGKMECLLPEFVTLVREVLHSGIAVLGTVAERAGGLPAELRRSPLVELIRVTVANRERLPEELARRFRR